MASKYLLRFTLHSQSASLENLRSLLAEFADSISITEALPEQGHKPNEFLITLHTDDPTLVFDACSQAGRIKSVKVEESH